jgi:PPK2 family polyphosphate:nucleotide phosphotransferase
MFEAADSPYLVPFDDKFKIAKASTVPPKDAPKKKELEAMLAEEVERLAELQEMLYAADHHSLLVIFQAMDAAGKDGTIRSVFSGINPAGCQVYSFKAPSLEELDHDFLWRTSRNLPERGRIGIFNRSYYEETLVVRVHPEFLAGQRLPDLPKEGKLGKLWEQRFESIRDHERHLARNGVVILKFFLHVSKEEQRQRFLARLDEPAKNWKFNAGDVKERAHFDDYMAAYQEALSATSRSWAPWYCIPADSKRFMRWQVAKIVSASLQKLGIGFPEVTPEERARFDELRRQLENE